MFMFHAKENVAIKMAILHSRICICCNQDDYAACKKNCCNDDGHVTCKLGRCNTLFLLYAGREVAERYAASVGAQHFNTSAKLNKVHKTKPNIYQKLSNEHVDRMLSQVMCLIKNLVFGLFRGQRRCFRALLSRYVKTIK